MWCLAGCMGGPGTPGCSTGRACLGRVPGERDGAMLGAAGGREVRDKPQRTRSSTQGGCRLDGSVGPPPQPGRAMGCWELCVTSLCRGCKGRASLGLGCSLPGSPDARVMGRRQCP